MHMDGAAVIKRLARDGWELKRVSGSHQWTGRS